MKIYNNLVLFVRSNISLLKFLTVIIKKNPFSKGDPKLSLLLLAKYIELDSFNYSSKLKMGRTLQTSVNLFHILVEKYIENSSDIHLNQLLSVYSEEFLKRGKKNGRK